MPPPLTYIDTKARASDARFTQLDSRKPALVIGGDHPYVQWAGTGQAKLYSDNGIYPYLAINTNTTGDQNIDPGNTDMLSWAQVSAYSASGQPEVVAHGSRHPQEWSRLNTGIKINYAGASAAATVAITGSGATTTTMAFTATNADKPADQTMTNMTLAQLKTAIEGTVGWTVTIAPELLGTESAVTLLQIAATSVKANNQRFACGGGIWILYSGTAFRDVLVQTSANTLKIYADGVRQGAGISLTGGATLTSVVTAINALGVSGLSAKLMDNGKSDAGGSAFESYISGSELAVSLFTLSPGLSCMGQPLPINSGLNHWYMVERQLQKCVSVAASNGVTLTDFAQPGSGFMTQYRYGHNGFGSMRGNLISASDVNFPANSPVAIPSYQASQWHGHTALLFANYPDSTRTKAIWRALADSPGFLCNILMHKVLDDGQAGYSFPSTDPSYYDQLGTQWVDAIQNLGPFVASGAISNLKPSDIPTFAGKAAKPSNFIFNPKFQNSGETLITTPTNVFAISGWRLLTAPADFSAVTVDTTGFNATMTTASERIPLSQVVFLEYGRTYRIGCYTEVSNYASGNGVSLQLNTLRGYVPLGWALQQNTISRSRFSTARSDQIEMTFTVPDPQPFGPARIVSGSFGAGINMATNKNIRLNVFARGAFDIDLSAGAASSAAVQAYEAAAAINTAIKAQFATYPAELQTLARAENGKLILEVPRRGPDGSFVMTVVDGSTLSITSTVFGSSDNFAYARQADAEPFAFPMQFNILAALSSGASFKVSSPYISEVYVR